MTDSVPASSFAQLLWRFRRAADLTQEQLAERASLSPRTVSDLERGENRAPRRDTLDLLAAALQLSAEDRVALEATIVRTRTETPSQAALDPTLASTPDPDGPPINLPAQPTPFIGREREVETVRARLLDEDTRLLTLTGPGGVGKTRLVVQAAAAARADFADGIIFVGLAPVSDPDLVLSTVAQALGIGEAPGQAIADTLTAALRDKQMLLVLDNVEQVLPAAQPVMALLLAAPRVKALVTSRAALRVRGERIHEVSPLAVPRPPLPPLEALSQYEAVRLFIARAQDVQPDFAVTNKTAPAVAEICARLDGLPLAIELAAARTRLLPPDALLARLSNRLKVVTGGSKDLPARQQTLRAAIDWSYTLLDPGEQTLFARLAVFVGGRTLEAVEAVCNANGDLPVDVLDGVESLLDKSLLRREVGGGNEPRLVMLETIHEYARERLEARGERAATERAHALYYLALAEEAEPCVREEDPAWLARLDGEHDNLRAALRWASEGGEAARELRLAAALGRFWEARAHWTEGRRHLREALARAPEAATSARARALRGAGYLAFAQGDMGEAQRLTEEAFAAYRVLGDERDVPSTLSNLSHIARRRGDYAAAMRHSEEGLEVARRLGDQMAVAGTLNNMGLAAMEGGELERAMDLLTESLVLFRALGNRAFVAMVLQNQGFTAVHRGDYATAERLLQEAFDLYQTLGETYGLAVTLQCRGLLLLRRGDVDVALADLRRALDMQHDMGANCEGAETLTWIAWACQEMGQVEWAARLYGAAEALCARLGVVLDIPSRSLYDGALARLRRELPADAYAAAWAAGHALSAEQAYAEALER